MFGVVGETPFDLRFRLFGIPVRIHPFFWVFSAMMGWDPEHLDLVFLGVMCVFVSILVHELGHAVVLRHYGWPSEIVLYFMGGYATATRLSTWRAVWSLAAGPVAGFSLGALVYVVMLLTRHFAPGLLQRFPALDYCFFMMNFSGLVWNLVNLFPVLPLDGGQIMASLVGHYGARGRQSTVLALQISIGTGAAVALWCGYCLQNNTAPIPFAVYSWLPETHGLYLSMLQPAPKFVMILFGILCAQSVIEYNNLMSRR